MNKWDITFGETPLDQLFSGVQPGGTVSSAALLAALDTESEEALVYAFEWLKAEGVQVDLSDLPPSSGDSQIAARLLLEQQMADISQLQENLEEDDPLQLYLQELAAIPAWGDLQVLASELKEANDGNVAYSKMPEILNLCLSRVLELAFRYTGKGLLLLDLIQEGSMGLWEALTHYRGGDFEDYRDDAIRFSMTKAVLLQAHAAGVGQRLRGAVEDYRSVDERLLGELGRSPTLEEIAQALHITSAEAAVAGQLLQTAREFNRTLKPQEEEMPQEEDQAVEDTAYFQMRQRVAELLSGLSKEDAALLTMRYGLEGGAPQTPQQVAAKLGIPVSQVSSREAEILSKLRQNH